MKGEMKMTRRSTLMGAAATLALPALLRAQPATPPRLRCRFAGEEIIYQLLDNATARDLVSLLPLDLTIEDFSTNEKLAYLPRRLDQKDLVPFDDETPGDLCYFLGWGNLAFFHAAYQYRGDLIRLGHIEGPVTPLLTRGEFPLRLDLVA